MAQVTRFPSTVVNAGGWSGVPSVYASDDVRASVGTSGSDAFIVGGFDFASAIPADATFNSMTATIEHHESATTTSLLIEIIDGDASLIRGSATVVTTTTTDTVETVTVSPNVNYTSPTIAQIRSANFQLRVTGAKTGGGGSRTFNVDHVYLTLDYSLPVPKTGDDAGTGVDAEAPVQARPATSGPGLRDSFTRLTQYEGLQESFADGRGQWGTKYQKRVHPTTGLPFLQPECTTFFTFRTDQVTGRLQLRDRNGNTISPYYCMYAPDFDATQPHEVEFTIAYHREGAAAAGVGFQGHFLDNDGGGAPVGPSWAGLVFQNNPGASQVLPMIRGYRRGNGTNIAVAGINENFGLASRPPQAGDRVRVTFNPTTYVVTCYNLTLGESHGQGTLDQGWQGLISNYGVREGDYKPIHVGPAQYGSTLTDQVVFEWADMVIRPAGTATPTTIATDTYATTEAESLLIAGRPYRLELWEAGVFKALLLEDTLQISSEVLQEIVFDASLLSDPTGADMEVRLTSSAYSEGGVPLTIDVEAMVWDAEYLVPDELPKSGSDSGSGAEGESVDKTLTGSDSGSADDAVTSLSTEEGSVTLGAADAGVGDEAEVLAVSQAAADSSAAVEATTLVVTLSMADSATGFEATLPFVVTISVSDSAGSLESQEITGKTVIEADSVGGVDYESVLKPPKVMLHSAERTLVGRASFDLQ